MDSAFLRGEDLPPVELYELAGSYFVRDGNHRVSVVRFHGLPLMEADVTELRPLRYRAEGRAA